MSRPRDSQRARLYAAERLAFPLYHCGEEPFLNDLSSIDKWLLEKCVHSDWWSSRNAARLAVPSQTWTTYDGRGSRAARGGMHRLAFPRWSRNRYVILHEFSHHLTARMYGYTSAASHGPEFCENYLWLVTHVLGVDDGRKLESQYLDHKIRYTPGK